MKSYSRAIISLALITTLTTQPQQAPKKPYTKQAAKAAPRRLRNPKRATKLTVKTDKELLRDQIEVLSDDYSPIVLAALNNSRELKDFCYKNLCPIKNLTKQDEINTAIWIRKAYTIMKKGPDKKNGVMPDAVQFFEALLYSLFMKSPYCLNLSDDNQHYLSENGLIPYLEILVKQNMKTDLKDVKPMNKKPMDY